MRPKRDPDVEAIVTFTPMEDGGRSCPAFSGYRPNHLVLPGYLTSGHHEYRQKDRVLPGESAETEIWFITPEAYPNSLMAGQTISVQEGSRVVGSAKILKVLNPLLQK